MLSIQVLLIVATTLYQAIAVWLEDRRSPPDELIDVGGYRLHLCVKGTAKPTIWTIFLPLQGTNKLRDKMHRKLGNLSTNCM